MEARIMIDASDLERRLERIKRDQERDNSRPRTKIIMADPFINALVENGLLPTGTTYIRITGEVGGVLRLDYETFATTELVAVAESMKEASDHVEARVK